MGVEKKYNVHILEGYGFSETCQATTFSQMHKPYKTGLIEFPLWSIETKVFNEQSWKAR